MFIPPIPHVSAAVRCITLGQVKEHFIVTNGKIKMNGPKTKCCRRIYKEVPNHGKEEPQKLDKNMQTVLSAWQYWTEETKPQYETNSVLLCSTFSNGFDCSRALFFFLAF